MRANGVPNFPDQTFSGGQHNAGPGGVNPQSPAFKQAAAACGVGGKGNADSSAHNAFAKVIWVAELQDFVAVDGAAGSRPVEH